jgi:hypothetical protein
LTQDSSGSGYRTVAGFYENGNKICGSVEFGKFD